MTAIFFLLPLVCSECRTFRQHGRFVTSCVYLYTGVSVCLMPIVLVDLLGLEKLSNAFGLVLLFQGIGAFAGPQFAGLYLTYGWLCS